MDAAPTHRFPGLAATSLTALAAADGAGVRSPLGYRTTVEFPRRTGRYSGRGRSWCFGVPCRLRCSGGAGMVSKLGGSSGQMSSTRQGA